MTDTSETAMQRAFEELLHHLKSGRNTVEAMRIGTGQMEALMERLADLLTVARNHHTVALIDLPFLLPLIKDVDEWTLRRLFAQSNDETREKFKRALSNPPNSHSKERDAR